MLLQACMFVDDTVVSKGMVKYASQINRESIVDLGGIVTVPANPIESCSQQQVGAHARALVLSLKDCF